MTAVLDRPAPKPPAHAAGLEGIGQVDDQESTGPTGPDRERSYQDRMRRSGHGLIAALDAEPAPSLREFAGQPDAPYHRSDWFDHPRLWLDRDLVEVLSVEPYCDVRDPAVARTIAADLAGLPLLLDGPHPGVWNASTTLLLFRRDHNRPPLPSYADQLDAAAELADRAARAGLAASERLAAELDPPTTHSLRGLVAAVLADPGLLHWAAGRLAAHVLARHLPAERAVALLDDVAVAGAPPWALFRAAWTDQAYRALGAAHDEVRELLGPDFLTRCAALEGPLADVGTPERVDIPDRALIRQWLAHVETAARYDG